MQTKFLTDNQQKWAWVIAFVVVPFIVVHLFPTSYVPRLFAMLWIYTLSPVVIFLLAIFTRQTIKLKNYSNPVVEKRLALIARGGGVILSLVLLIYLTFPLLIGTYNLYIQQEPLEVIEDLVTSQSTAVLAPGLYLGLRLSQSQNDSYTYYFPTIFRFGDSKFKFMILPGTHFILDVEPI